jgi:hypothetical protein
MAKGAQHSRRCYRHFIVSPITAIRFPQTVSGNGKRKLPKIPIELPNLGRSAHRSYCNTRFITGLPGAAVPDAIVSADDVAATPPGPNCTAIGGYPHPIPKRVFMCML